MVSIADGNGHYNGQARTVEEIAQAHGMKRVSGEWHGKHPTGDGATSDGFILNDDGTAWDRPTDRRYTSPQTAELFGIQPNDFAPVREYRERNGQAQNHAPNTPAVTPTKAKTGKAATKAKPIRETISDYHDATGKVLFQVVRQEYRDGTKDFPMRQADGRGGWVWNLKGIERVLYHLPEVLTAQIIFVVEGEKCADRLNKELSARGEFGSSIATTNPGGAGKWRDSYSEVLARKQVIFLPDNDEPGEKHQAKACPSIADHAATLKVLSLPNLPKKGDVVNWLDAGGTLETLLELADAAPDWTPAEQSTLAAPATDKTTGDGKKTQADALLKIAQDEVQIFRDDSDTFFATITKPNGGRFTHRINSQAFRAHLSARFHAIHGHASASAGAHTAAMDVLRGQHDAPAREVYTRIAATPDAIYYDLGDATGRVVEITADGWKIIASTPVAFARPRGMLAQIEPQRGGIIEQLRPCLNVADDNDFHLIIAWLLGCFQPDGGKVHLSFSGEQGTAKSANTRRARAVIDPHRAPTRKQPKDDHDLIIGAQNNAVLAFDNLSHLPQWMSDSLCRLATGAGDATRQLYSDDEEMIFSIKRPVIFNAITDVATKPDLLDRLLLLELPPLPAGERKTERELDCIFDEARPLVLGALFDAVAVGLKNLPTTKPRNLPRMADFAQWVEACAPGLGWESGHFLKIYNVNRENVIDTAANLSTVAQAVEIMLEARRVFIGTPTELFHALNKAAPDDMRRARDWPNDAKATGAQLQRIAPVLRARGFEIDNKRSNGIRKWTLKIGSNDQAKKEPILTQ